MEILQAIARRLDEKSILGEDVEMLGVEPAPEVLESLTKILDESNFIVLTKARFHTKPIPVNEVRAAVEDLHKLLESDIKGVSLEKEIGKILVK